jgi:hypothetical protein
MIRGQEPTEAMVITGPMFEGPVQICSAIIRSDKSIFLLVKNLDTGDRDSIVLREEHLAFLVLRCP